MESKTKALLLIIFLNQRSRSLSTREINLYKDFPSNELKKKTKQQIDLDFEENNEKRELSAKFCIDSGCQCQQCANEIKYYDLLEWNSFHRTQPFLVKT